MSIKNKVTGQLSNITTYDATTGAISDIGVSGNVQGNNLVGNTVTGTLTTALQPAITQVGTLGSLAVAGGLNTGTLGVSGNTTLGNLNVTGITNITGNITQISGNSAQFFGDSDGFGALYAGLAFGYSNLVQTVLQVSANYNDFAQINLQNTDSGSNATADYVATADNGTDATYYVDLGIASSTFDGASPNIAGNSILTNDAYLYTVGNTAITPGGNLIIGAATEGKIIKLIAGGGDTSNIVATIANTGVSVTGTVSATGNINGNYIIGNGSQLTGLPAGYANANVFSYLANSNVVISTTGNITSANLITGGQVSASGNITGNYILGNGALLSGLSPTSIFNGTSNVSIPTANGNITMSVANTANVVTVTANSVIVNGNISSGNVNVTGVYATSGIYSLGDAVLGNTANASATKTRIVSFAANSYIQTGNGTSGTTGNVIFAPYADSTARVRIDTSSGNINATGNIAANNIGNITPINLNQSPTQQLYGDGLWKDSISGTTLNITKFAQGAAYGTNFFIAGGRLFAIAGRNLNYTSGLGQVNPTAMNGIPNTYEIIFPNETVGTLTDAGSYGVSAYALFANGNLYTWGVNNYGQLGLGNTTNTYVPTLASTSVAQVYTHPSQMNNEPNFVRLIIRKTNNTYFGCGYDGEYQLGLGTNTAKTSFTALPWIPADAISVWNLGNYQGNLFVQKADGLISATGYNGYGQLGVNATATPTTPINSNLWLNSDVSMRIQYISYGGRYSNSGGTSDYYWIVMFLDNGTTSRLVGAGANNWGTLGTGNTTNSIVPVAPLTSTGLTGRISKIRNTGSAPGTMYVLMANGDLFTYGYNEFGAVGNGTTTQANTPYKLLTGNCADIINDQMGWYTFGYYTPGAIVKKTDGLYYCCGYNSQGQVGVNQAAGTITTLQQMAFPKGAVIKFVGTNNGNSDGIAKYVITADNQIWAWGYNGYYNIVNGGSGGQVNNLWAPVAFAPTVLRNV